MDKDAALVDVQITSIQNELIEIKKTLAFIEEHIVKATDTIDKVSAEVMPTIDMLMKHPMLKMFIKEKK